MLTKIAVVLVLFAGMVCASFNRNRCRNIVKKAPHYITEYKPVPYYTTLYDSKYYPSPVPKVIIKTEYIDKYVTKTLSSIVVTTEYQPQYVYNTVYVTQTEKEKFEQFVPQYVTKTNYYPEYVTHAEYHTVKEKVKEYVTQCDGYDYVYDGY